MATKQHQDAVTDYSSYFKSTSATATSAGVASSTDFQELVRHLTHSISEMDVMLRVAVEKEGMVQQEL